jgi:heptosyltransferase-1
MSQGPIRTLLIVKLSALGDQIFMLPAISDAMARWPGLTIDWVVDERFSDIPRLHHSVRRVFAVPSRRWRQHWASPGTWSEVRTLIGRLREQEYDLVLDAQGMWKSLFFSKLAITQQRVVHAPQDCGEPFVTRFYERVAPPMPQVHGTHRLRRLMAFALHSDPDGRLNYGLHSPAPPRTDDYAVLVPNASKPEKLWPDEHWIAIGRKLSRQGMRIVLPWGSTEEQSRARRLAAEIPNAEVAVRMVLPAWAAWLAHARLVVGLDTGLVHMAAAYRAPTVAIFTATRTDFFAPTDPWLGRAVGSEKGAPSLAQVEAAIDQVLGGKPQPGSTLPHASRMW